MEIIATCFSLAGSQASRTGANAASSIAMGRKSLLRWVGCGELGLCFLLWEGDVALGFLLVEHEPLLFCVACSRDKEEHML